MDFNEHILYLDFKYNDDICRRKMTSWLANAT